MTKPAIVVTIGFLVLFALLFAYASTKEPPSSAPNPLGERRFIVSEVEKLRAKLNDPESARFRDEFVSKSGGKPMVCGQVNVRNSVGGYVGFQPFVAGEAAHKTRDQAAPGEMDALWAEHCRDKPRSQKPAGAP